MFADGKKINLSTKVILMVEFILLISSVLFCTVSVYRERIAIRRAINQRMLDIANCASGSVNGDSLKSVDKDSVGNSEYNEIYKTLAVFRDNAELEYVYVIRDSGEQNFIFVMDTDPDDPAVYGEEAGYTQARALAAAGTAAVDEVPYSDEWGKFYSAYSPVFDSKGSVAGIITVDFAADWFEGQLTAQTRSNVLSCIAILLLSLAVAAILSMLTVRPFMRMQAQLLEEKISAESANRAKSEFLANMSHEIRTPINAMLGMNEMIIRESELAKRAADSAPQTSKNAIKSINVYAADVKKAGNNLLSIVNDILDFSKTEEGRMEISCAPYKLCSLLNDLSNMILFKAHDKGLSFSVDVDHTIPNDLFGDEVRIRQILTNILNNAIKYTQAGSVDLTVKGRRQDDGMYLLSFVVEDTGIGIKGEDLEKLFTRFGRLEMEHNSTIEGTGLGLVITKRLLDAMGGDINVSSEHGKGSVFTVTIPQKALSGDAVGDFKERFSTFAEEPTGYRESFTAPLARILVVDDTRTNQIVVTSLLKDTKMQMDTASSGKESVEMAAKTKYDVILMDQRMPEMEGSEAMHHIHETPGGASSDSPIICLTADAVIGAKERYLAEGFDDYMTKPVEGAALEKMILKYLPKEKICRADDPANSEKQAECYDLHTLKAAGIDTAEGFRYSNNDDELYRSILTEYAKSKEERSRNLQTDFESKNWDDYGIYAHSLKSSSRMIGAAGLSAVAARLEAAANSKDEETIRKEHGSMMKQYTAVTDAIISTLMIDIGGEDEGDVLEFTPG